MNLTCYVVDDDCHAVNAVVKHIEKTPELTCIGTHTDPIAALKEIKLKQPDLVFLDVEMPELSGIEVASLLPEGTFIVFITSHSKYAVEAIQKDAIGYLLKPFSYHMFVTCIDKIKARTQKTDMDNNNNKDWGKIFLNTGTKGKLTQINVSEIRYVEALKNTISIHAQKEVFLLRSSIKNIIAQLPNKVFIRIHRSYIVNIDHIRSVDGSTVTLLNDAIIPFGEQYKARFMDCIRSRTIKG
ncbi:LytTR family DNA-binding domain-containing protein [Pedobacter sp. Hv1]|uniref:LytR/AlgR family response regulator transcription factor n=1 Tax=Pedobacter sp. Hv1 TaxID=1740090 RepID=UPI0006D8C7F4|nr:LytTR family DNA-binding domain-containing protein [Pedobacter sp. Hv1]KQB99155.1 hypothetical protein AQF98_16360 [Pedobacter sp. Hv1]